MKPRFLIRKGVIFRSGPGRGITRGTGWIVTDRVHGTTETFIEHATALVWVRMQLHWERALR